MLPAANVTGDPQPWKSERRLAGDFVNRQGISLPEHQGETEVGEIEQKELDGHRTRIIGDVAKLVEKYRAIFDWDVPDIDQYAADKLILVEVRKALDDVEKTLLNRELAPDR